MKNITFLLLFVTGCAHTELRDPRTGKTVFRTEADATNVTYTGPGYSFHADKLIQSVPTVSGGTAASHVIQSVGMATGSVGAAVATSGIIRK